MYVSTMHYACCMVHSICAYLLKAEMLIVGGYFFQFSMHSYFLLSSFFFLRIKISTKFCSFFDLTIDHRIIGYYYTSHLSSCCLLTVVLATTNSNSHDRLVVLWSSMHDDSDSITPLVLYNASLLLYLLFTILL